LGYEIALKSDGVDLPRHRALEIWLACASIVCAELGGSMSFLRRWRRSEKALPPAWQVADGEKNK
jgi:hypothetical protein